MGASGLGSGDDFALWHGIFRIADVVLDAAFKEPGVLKHHPKAVAQFGAAHGSGIDAIDGDAPTVNLIEAHEEVDEGGFTGTGWANDGYFLPGMDGDIHILHEQAVWGVAETNVFKGDTATAIFRYDAFFGVRRFFFCVEQGKDAVAGGGGGAEASSHFRNRGKWLGKTAGVFEHGLHVPDGDASGNGPKAADGGTQHIAEVVDKAGDWADCTGSDIGLVGTFTKRFVEGVEIGTGALSVAKGLNHGLAVDHFFDVAVEATEEVLLLHEVLAAGFHDTGSAEHGERHHEHRNQCELGADGKHHQKNPDGSDDLGDNGGEILADGVIDGVHIVGDDTQDVAVGVGVVVVELQAVHFGINVVAQGFHHLSGDFCHPEALQKGEGLADEVEKDEAC